MKKCKTIAVKVVKVSGVKVYRKTPTVSDTRNNGYNYRKIGTVSFYHRVMGSKDADAMTNSVEPDQTCQSKNLGSLRCSCFTVYLQCFTFSQKIRLPSHHVFVVNKILKLKMGRVKRIWYLSPMRAAKV